MGVEIKGIIEKIKQEGVNEAEKKAEEIISLAEQKAKNTIMTAEKEKENILNKAKEEAKRIKDTGCSAVKQAHRDLLLSVREEIIKLFDKVVKKDVKEQFSPDVLKKAVGTIMENFSAGGKTNLELILPEEDKASLKQYFTSKLKKKMTEGVTIKTSHNIEKGFFVGKKGENSYYDFSDDAIAEAVNSFLNPKVVEMLKKL